MTTAAPTKTSAAAKPHKARVNRHGGSSDGTQAIRRATSVLKTIAGATPVGATLADISRAEGLPKSTAHRILKCLMDEGLVEHMEGNLRYQLGALVYELGLAVPQTALEVARWRPVIETVAQRTGVTSYLMRRTGMEAVCLVKAEGHSVVRIIPVEVGQRRFLGVGAGSTALLAALDEATAERHIKAIAPELRNYPLITEATLRESVRQARASGVAISQGKVMQQSFGIGMAIPGDAGPSTMAISIAAHLSTVQDADVTRWTHIIREEIENALRVQKGVAT